MNFSFINFWKWVTLWGTRRSLAKGYFTPKLSQIRRWVFTHRETTNFTYDLTDTNKDYLVFFVSSITQKPWSEIEGYLAEITQNKSIRDYVVKAYKSSDFAYMAEDYCEFGRRLGWYLFVRALKPKTVVETGVDKGLGAVLLCEALLKNKEEGFLGRYYGTDINPQAGYLLQSPYSEMGEILFGDSIESLHKFPSEIDLFINDSDHSATYEYEEYKTVRSKLSSTAIILGDNSHSTDSLMRFSKDSGRQFLFFREIPKDHWYPGGGIGVSY